jgi:hypothetical protein
MAFWQLQSSWLFRCGTAILLESSKTSIKPIYLYCKDILNVFNIILILYYYIIILNIKYI